MSPSTGLGFRCLLDGKPFSGDLPERVTFVGMEKTPNEAPRYGRLSHPWFNLPCYESKGNQNDPH